MRALVTFLLAAVVLCPLSADGTIVTETRMMMLVE